MSAGTALIAPVSAKKIPNPARSPLGRPQHRYAGPSEAIRNRLPATMACATPSVCPHTRAPPARLEPTYRCL